MGFQNIISLCITLTLIMNDFKVCNFGIKKCESISTTKCLYFKSSIQVIRSSSYHSYFSFSSCLGMQEFVKRVFCCCCYIILVFNYKLNFKTNFFVSLAVKETRNNAIATIILKQKTKTKTQKQFNSTFCMYPL